MITEQLFNDALSKIFIRFDEMDEKMDRQYRQLRASIDHVSTGLDETNVNVAGLQSKVEGLQSKVEGLQSEVAGLHSKVAEVQADLKEFREEQRVFNMKIEERIIRLESVTGA